MIDPILDHPKDQITQIIDKIYKAGMTTTSGGNISIKESSGDIWVTPSAVDKGSLTRKDIIQVTAEGETVGMHKPSSEFPFHKAIYDIRPDIKSVIHAHPPALVSFSIVRQIPNTNVIPQAKHVCGPIGYAEYAMPGSEELGAKIAAEFAKGVNAVIMENHGVVVGGSDLKDAYNRFETLELTSKTLVGASTIGKPKLLSNEQIRAFEESIPNQMPEIRQVEYPSDELSLRTKITKMVQRACDQNLMIGSYGTVSARWRGNDFLITPTDKIRWDIKNKDIVQIKDGKREAGKLPSRAVYLHQQIYKDHPEINSIIITQSPHVMAFGVCDTHFDVRTIPESWIFLQDVARIKFGDHFVDTKMVSRVITKDTPTAIINNDCIVVTGDQLLNTFDRLEVAEFSAQSLILAQSLGNIVPIGQLEIEELRTQFLS